MSLDAQIAAMFSALKTVRGVSVTYRRAGSSAAVNAVIGRTAFEAVSPQGMVETFLSVDYLIAAADLVLDGTPTKPARGDRITDSAGKVFEVVPPADSGQHYRAMDPGGSLFRVHTKQVA